MSSLLVKLGSLAAVLLLFLLSNSSYAKDYPERPVKVVIPYGAGGSSDAVGRAYTDRLSQITGQQFVVENKGGAGGSIGAEFVQKSAKDGYTLLLAPHSSLVITPHVRQTPFSYTDFTQVAKIASAFSFIAVHPSVPAKTFKDLIEYSKANPGEINYGSASVGGIQHLRLEAISRAGGLGWVNVPYRGSGEAVIDILAGQIELIAEVIVMPHMRAGKLRGLALLDTERHPDFPEIPTLKEAAKGLPFENLSIPSLFSIFGPADLPRDVVVKLNTIINGISAEKETQAKLFQQGYRSNQGYA